MIKVLMLLHNLRVSAGVSSYVMNYFRSIDHDKVKMDFAIWSDIPTPYYKEIEENGSTVYVLPPIKNINKHYNACKQILENEQYDVIHDNTLLISYPIMRAACKKHVPVRILHSHNSKLGETRIKEIRNKAFLPFLIRTATNYASCSELAAKAMFGEKEYYFIPNIVSSKSLVFDFEERQRIRDIMGVEDKTVVATIGRVALQKNPFLAVDVMEKVISRNENIEYWWIGSGLLDDELKDYVKKKNMANNIRLLGSRDDVKELLQAIDVFFLPSLFEGLPVTAIEAQTMGLPSVISDSITKQLVFTDLVRYMPLDASVDEWADCIIDIIRRVPERRGYTEELLHSPFSDITAGKRLADYYHKVLNSN